MLIDTRQIGRWFVHARCAVGSVAVAPGRTTLTDAFNSSMALVATTPTPRLSRAQGSAPRIKNAVGCRSETLSNRTVRSRSWTSRTNLSDVQSMANVCGQFAGREPGNRRVPIRRFHFVWKCARYPRHRIATPNGMQKSRTMSNLCSWLFWTSFTIQKPVSFRRLP